MYNRELAKFICECLSNDRNPTVCAVSHVDFVHVLIEIYEQVLKPNNVLYTDVGGDRDLIMKSGSLFDIIDWIWTGQERELGPNWDDYEKTLSELLSREYFIKESRVDSDYNTVYSIYQNARTERIDEFL